jgi:hypothetical protein
MYIDLRPLIWRQSVEHYASINVEGRRFSARCTVSQGSDLTLNNKLQLETLPVEIFFFETTRMQSQLAELPQGALGRFSFFSATSAHEDIPAMGAFLSGWFVLNAQSLEDTWNQVLEAGYTECTITLGIGPVESLPLEGWLWNVTENPHLVIDTVSVAFERPAPRRASRDEQKRSSFWRS